MPLLDVLRQAEPGTEGKGAADAGFTLDADLALHHLHQTFANGEPQTGTAIFACGGGIGLGKGLEQACALLLGESDAGILDAETELHTRRLPLYEFAPHDHLALLGKFNGIVAQVGENLSQSSRIPHQMIGHIVAGGVDQLQPLLLALGADQHRKVGQHLIQLEGNRLHGELACLDLGKIENVVDDAEQRLGRCLNFCQIIVLLFIEIGLQGQIAHANHSIHGRADFVTHVGQKIGFVLIGALQLLGFFTNLPATLLQNAVFLFDLPVLLLHILGARCQFGGRLLQLVLLTLQLLGLLLGLIKQYLGALAGLGRVDGDGNRRTGLLQKGLFLGTEGKKGTQLQHPLDDIVMQQGRGQNKAGRPSAKARFNLDVVVWDLGKLNHFPFQGHLPHQSCAEGNLLVVALAPVKGIAGRPLQFITFRDQIDDPHPGVQIMGHKVDHLPGQHFNLQFSAHPLVEP